MRMAETALTTGQEVDSRRFLHGGDHSIKAELRQYATGLTWMVDAGEGYLTLRSHLSPLPSRSSLTPHRPPCPSFPFRRLGPSPRLHCHAASRVWLRGHRQSHS